MISDPMTEQAFKHTEITEKLIGYFSRSTTSLAMVSSKASMRSRTAWFLPHAVFRFNDNILSEYSSAGRMSVSFAPTCS